MITGKISFSISVAFDGDYSFAIEAVKPGVSARVDFWGNPDALQQFGESLAQFPVTAADRVRFEVGKPEYSHYNYLLLEAFCYSPLGSSAIKVLAANKEPEPNCQRVEFSIRAEAASINKLGRMLLNWDAGRTSVVEWEAQAG